MRDEIGWLPPPLNEYPTTCIQIQIPNNLEFRAAFFGALAELGKGYNWQVGGDEERERAISAYWNRLIFDELTEDCEGDPMATVFRFTAECGLEYSPDGTNWTPVDGWSEFAETCFEGPAGPAGADGAAGPAGPQGPAGPTAPDPLTAPLVPPTTNGMRDACTVATAVVTSVLDNYVLPSLDLYVDEIIALGMSELDTQRELLQIGTGGAISSGLNAIWGNVTQALYSAGLAVGSTIHATILTFSAWLKSMDAVKADNARDNLRLASVKAELICMLFTCLDDSTNLTQAVVDCWTAAIASSGDIHQDAKDALLSYMSDNLPLYALRMEAVYNADTPANCNSCIAEHFYEWDFTQSMGDWALALADGIAGTWVSGQGWKSTLRQSGADRTDELRIGRSFSSSFNRSLVRVEIEGHFTRGQIQFGGLGRGEMHLRDAVTLTTLAFTNANWSGEFIDDVPPAANTFRTNCTLIAIASQRTNNVPAPRGDVLWSKLRFWYNGDNANFTGGNGY